MSSRGAVRCGWTPPTLTDPAAGATRPTRAESSVDLPAPLRPMRATVSPGVMVSVTSWSTSVRPRRTARFSTTAAGWEVGLEMPEACLRKRRRREEAGGPPAGRAASAVSAPGSAPGLAASCVIPSRCSRNAPALRRASRTVSGRGDQPASRPRATTGGYTGDTAMTSDGVPRVSGAPGEGRRATWSAYWMTRSRRCSAMRTVVPRSWTRRWRTASTSSAAAGSRADVGSSRTSTPGCGVRTEPIATRCCWPPESVEMARSRRSARPSRSRVSSTRRRITSAARPSDSIPYASSSSTVSVTKCDNGSWPTVPTTSASSRGLCVRVSRPATVTRPRRVPPVKCGTSPFTAPSSVDLPTPEGPTSSINSPSGTESSMPSTVGPAAPSYVTETSSKRIMRAPCGGSRDGRFRGGSRGGCSRARGRRRRGGGRAGSPRPATEGASAR